MLKRTLVIAGGLLTLAGCVAPQPVEAPKPVIQYAAVTEEQAEQAKAAVLERMIDPESSRFRSIYSFRAVYPTAEDNGICGGVNSKNQYGGYTGFIRFMIINNEVYLDGDSWMGTNYLAEYCSNAG